MWLALILAVLTAVLWPAARGLRLSRFLVEGISMAPTLLPGDRVLVLGLPRRWWRPQSGQLVLARPAALGGLEVVKRVHASGASSDSPGYELRGDNPDASTDSRHYGPVSHREIVGLVWLRYWPQERRGRVR